MPIHGLPVQGRPEGTQLDAFGVGRRQQPIALSGVRQQQQVEPVIAAAVRRLQLEMDVIDGGEGGGVALRQAAFPRQPFGQAFELGAAEGGVEVGQAVVVAHGIVFEGPGVGLLGGGGEVPGALREFAVCGEYRAATAAGDDLVAVEAEGGEPSPAAGVAAAAPRAEGFGGVFDEGEPVALGDGRQFVHARRMAEHVHHHQGANGAVCVFVETAVAAQLGDVGQVIGQALRVDAQGLCFAIDEMWRGAELGHRVGAADEGQGGQQYLVAGLHAGEYQAGVQGGRAVDGGDGVGDAGDLGEGLLEAIHVLAHGGDPAAVEAVGDQRFFRVAEAWFVQAEGALRWQQVAQNVEDGFRRGHQMSPFVGWGEVRTPTAVV